MTPESGGPELRLDRMSWPEVRDRLDDGDRTAVVAAGAIEQHGPHLPLLVDAEHGDRLAAEIASRLGDALVAPTIRVGCSEHHMAFPGTISLAEDTLAALCRDYCTSLSRHGFRRICLAPTHGGNFGVIEEALPALNASVGSDSEVRAFTDLEAVVETWRSVVEESAGRGSRVGGHADIAETSILALLRPELVQGERARAGYSGPTDRDTLDRIIEEGFDSVTESGILGDARGFDPAIGERCVAELADLMAEHFRAG